MKRWQDALLLWLERLAGVLSVGVWYSNKLVTRVPQLGSVEDRRAVVDAIEDAASLAGGARTFAVIATDGEEREVARLDVKVDAKALALARTDDRELSTREATATASVIAATDHRTVQATVKAVVEQNGESHNALVAMVRVFGESAGAILKGNAEALKTLDARSERDAKEIERLSADNSRLRTQNQELQELADTAMKEAEKLKQDSSDLVLLCRAAFGEQFREVMKGFLANNSTNGAASMFAGVVTAGSEDQKQ